MTGRQRAALRKRRAAARRTLDDLNDGRIGFAELRQALLADPGVRLLATKTQRPPPRPGAERLDLIAYRCPGGPRRASYWIVEWGQGWGASACYALAEAREHFRTWGSLPAWHRAPLLIEAREHAFDRRMGRV